MSASTGGWSRSSVAAATVTGNASVAPYGVKLSACGQAAFTRSSVAWETGAPAMNTRRNCGSDVPVCRQYSPSFVQSVGEPNDV